MQKSRLKFVVASALSAGLIFSSIGVANADNSRRSGSRTVVVEKHRNNNNGRNIGLGVAAVVIGTVIASQAARANSSSYRGDGMSCGQLERRCDDGQNWACRRLEVREDC